MIMSARNKALWRLIAADIECLRLDCFKCAKYKECGIRDNTTRHKPKNNLDFLCWPLVKAAVFEQDTFEVPYPKGD